MKTIVQFLKNEDGMETVEYAVMGALITLAVAGAITLLSDGVKRAFDSLTAKLPAAGS